MRVQKDRGRWGTAGPVATPSDAELRAALGRLLADAGLSPPAQIRRRASPYRTSFPLEELDLKLADSSELRLAFKQLGWDTLADEAQLAKPRFLHDPEREPAVYASVLGAAPAGPPCCYGSLIQQEEERYWLFIERVAGRELYQVGEVGLWEAAASWLGELHVRLGPDLARHAEHGRLLDYDEVFYWRWLERARANFRAPRQPASGSRFLEWLGERYGGVVEGLQALPKTVIHGEFFAANVLVAGGARAPRICPVDWEMSATAPGLIDLAALVSGGWEDEEREAIVSAYRATIGPATFSPQELDLARLHLAVQRLGWAPPSWIPPEGQRNDWLGEALALVERLDL